MPRCRKCCMRRSGPEDRRFPITWTPKDDKASSSFSTMCICERGSPAWSARRRSREWSSAVGERIFALSARNRSVPCHSERSEESLRTSKIVGIPHRQPQAVRNDKNRSPLQSTFALMNEPRQFAIGVDLGGTNMRIAALDADGKQLELITTSAEVKRGRDYVVADICDAIRALRKKFEGRYQFAGTGIGVPGIIDMETG